MIYIEHGIFEGYGCVWLCVYKVLGGKDKKMLYW